MNNEKYNLTLHFFFFNDTATTEIYTLSLHDALPICMRRLFHNSTAARKPVDPDARRLLRAGGRDRPSVGLDRKSTRLNSSHANISYAVFCLKKKMNNSHITSSYCDHSMKIKTDDNRI